MRRAVFATVAVVFSASIGGAWPVKSQTDLDNFAAAMGAFDASRSSASSAQQAADSRSHLAYMASMSADAASFASEMSAYSVHREAELSAQAESEQSVSITAAYAQPYRDDRPIKFFREFAIFGGILLLVFVIGANGYKIVGYVREMANKPKPVSTSKGRRSLSFRKDD